MPRQTGFLDKLVGRLERLDPESLQAQFVHIARERGLLETVFQSIQEGVLVVSAGARLRYANAAAERMLGIDAKRRRGRSIARLFPDVDWERLARRDEAEWQHLSSSEMEIAQPERRILSVYAVPLGGGGDSPATVSSPKVRSPRSQVPPPPSDPGLRTPDSGLRTPDSGLRTPDSGLRTPEDGENAVLLMLRDITRDRAAAEEEMESERMAAIRGLAASVAHEIGNPLSSLVYRLRLLQDDLRETHEVTDQTFEDLQVAESEVSRIDRILKQFLGAMRAAPPAFARDNVARVAERTLEALRPELEDRRVQVLVQCPEKLPDVYLDAAQIEQVFFNLLRNALQAMPSGGRLALGFASDDRNVVVSIRDTGSGIPETEFRRIFEPYHTTKANGHGIGLMVVQRIVHDHGGLVEVASKPGEGTVFRIVLPLADRRIRLIEAR